MQLYLAACEAWSAFRLSPSEYLDWPLSHCKLYDDFKQEVKDALFCGPGKTDDRLSDVFDHDLSMNQLRRIENIARLFEQGHYLKGCKKLRVI